MGRLDGRVAFLTGAGRGIGAATAAKLAAEPATLQALKVRLAQARNSAPLFDTDRFRRHLENAYTMMSERHRLGQRPASFDVAP